MDSNTQHALDQLFAKQPTKKKVEWTDAERAQLKAFILAARAKGISINTMNANFKELIVPIFPNKIRAAFWKMAGILSKEIKAEAAAAEAESKQA